MLVNSCRSFYLCVYKTSLSICIAFAVCLFIFDSHLGTPYVKHCWCKLAVRNGTRSVTYNLSANFTSHISTRKQFGCRSYLAIVKQQKDSFNLQ